MTITDIQTVLEKRELSIQIDSSRYTIRRIPTSPCKSTCPIDTDVKAYLGLIIAGKFEKALLVVKKDNPLPGICGRVCTHPCETECNRNEVDQPLAICSLKRFLADYEIEKGRATTGRLKPSLQPFKSTKKEKIAIIGSGPAGLTAANDLIRLGYGVTIFEALPVAGGMLRVGIPAYRLPREIIKTEIDAIKELGVKIKTRARITDLNKLKKQGYRAIFLAIGAHKGLKLGIPGEDEFEGFLDCITFLRAVNLAPLRRSDPSHKTYVRGKNLKLGKKVIVIGGGNAAIDSARTALRLGSDVHIVYRRSRKEMPANEWEIEEAEKEGVKLHYLASPVKILGENHKVVAMECIRNELGAPDASGRRRPVPVPGSEFKIPVDTVIPAISQQPDISWLPADHGLRISKWNSFVVDEETLATNISGIFAGGDCVTGPKIVIEAIAAGHKAAKSIDRYLRRKTQDARRKTQDEYEVVIEPEEKKERAIMPKLPLDKRRNFKEVELGLTEEMAIYEAKRCLRCGPCAECSECIKECDKRILSLSINSRTPQACGVNGMLLRAQVDKNKFPISHQPVEGRILWERKKIPVIIEPITARVNEEFCRGCGDCEEICEYSAPKLQDQGNGVFISKIDETACKGCGICSSICPSGAIELGHFTTKRIENLIEQAIKLN